MGHIYVVELAPGICKVGRSAHRFSRLAPYAPKDQELVAWTSPRFSGFRGAETWLIHQLSGSYPNLPNHPETFRVPFAAAVEVARTALEAPMNKLFVVDEGKFAA